MFSAERTIELYRERLLRQRIAANDAAHARLRGSLHAAGRSRAASALERARGTALRDIAANSGYVAAFSRARSALPRGTKGPPLLRPPIAMEESVRLKAWKTFEACARRLVAAWGEDRRLLLVTATCRNDPLGGTWLGRFDRVTARRDEVLAALSEHRVWGASLFDVQSRTRRGAASARIGTASS